MTSTKEPRGIRNNNPGNIRKSKDKWQGLSQEQPDTEFFSFKTPSWGIRAMARILINYYDDYDLNTISKIISRWAPPSENNTTSYANSVSSDSGIGVNRVVDLHEFNDLFPIIKAMIKHENGKNPYTDAQITKGLVLAGVQPDQPASIQKSPVVKTAQIIGVATVADQVSQHIESATPVFSLMNTMAHYAPVALTITVVVGVGYLVYYQWDKRRKGLD